MKKTLLAILCVVLSVVIVVVSVSLVKKDVPVYEQISQGELTTSETTTETTVPETTTEETTTEEVIVPGVVPVSASSPELEELVKDVAKKYGAQAIQVATIKNGYVSSTAQYGWAIVNQRSIKVDTKMRVASLSKTVVGMVTFKLIEEDKLDLDTDISEYLGVSVRNPKYPDLPITLRMLLTHTSGLTDGSYQNSLEKLQQYFKNPSAYSEKPGQIYRYNNFAFGVVGTICECVTGKSFNNLLKEYFLIPMGIEASYLAGQLDPNKLANIYSDGGGVGLSIDRQLRNKTDNNKVGGYMMLYAGGLFTSASDFAKLLTLFINDGMYSGRQLLSSESITEMHTQQLLPNNSVQCMPAKKGIGFYNQEYMYYHTGSAYGTYAAYVYNPDSKIGVVVNTTGAVAEKDNYGVYSVCGEIIKGIIEQELL